MKPAMAFAVILCAIAAVLLLAPEDESASGQTSAGVDAGAPAPTPAPSSRPAPAPTLQPPPARPELPAAPPAEAPDEVEAPAAPRAVDDVPTLDVRVFEGASPPTMRAPPEVDVFDVMDVTPEEREKLEVVRDRFTQQLDGASASEVTRAVAEYHHAVAQVVGEDRAEMILDLMERQGAELLGASDQ